jgi:hypothetical protein
VNARRHLVAALSEDGMGGIATLQDVDRAEQLVDAHRTEVLAEVVTWLVKKAREFHAVGTRKSEAQANAVAAMASKISRGAVRLNNTRMLPDAGFFETDHTYQRDNKPLDDTTWIFKVAAIATDPHGRGVAFGFLSRDDALWIAHAEGAGSWAKDGWTDITEGGEGQ